MRIYIRFLLIFSFFAILVCPLSAQNPIILTDNTELISLEESSVIIFEDDLWDLEEVTSRYLAGSFIPLDAVQVPSFIFERLRYWMCFTVTNNSDNNSVWIIKNHNAGIAHTIDYYVFEGKRLHALPGNPPKDVLQITLPPGQTKTFFFRFERIEYSLNSDIFSPTAFLKHSNGNSVFYGIFFSILFIMSLYNLFLFFSFKRISYIYYILFNLSFGSFYFILYGLFYSLFPSIANIEIPGIIIRNLMLVFFGLFSREFLQMKHCSKKIDKIVILLVLLIITATLIKAILRFKAYTLIETFLSLIFILLIIFIFIASFISLKKRYRPAKFFFIATSALLATFVFYSLTHFNVIPYPVENLLRFRIMEMAQLFMIVLFSLGLADSITTMREEKEEAQKLAIENLHTADRLKDEFLANTSHELRTPLTGIMGLADSLIAGAAGELPREAVNTLQLLIASGKRLINLVNDLLDFSRLKNRDISLVKKPVSIFEITDIVFRISSPLIKSKGIRLINDIDPSFPAVMGDENRIQQIMHNLVGNSIKFTESGYIKVSAAIQEDMAHIAVTDTGIGIPEKKQLLIFNSFEQADGSSTRIYGGTGIGLTITKQLVELHGGSMDVSSIVDKGSTFTFTLPLTDKKAIPLESQIEIIDHRLIGSKDDDSLIKINTRADIENSKILVVDDEEVNLKVLEMQLSMHSYEVTQCSNGQEALDLIAEGYKPDIVLLDIMMPRLNGYEVCLKLRETFSQIELPVIMLSAKNNISDLVEGFISGANDYITKPFFKSELFSRIENLLELSKNSQELQDLNKNLENKVDERTRELSEANRKIMSSIFYAQRIQISILPENREFAASFSDYFVMWDPREIVGGDFYWLETIGDTIMLALFDCTGHGIPGAFMSMIGNAILNHVVLEICNDDPARILKEANSQLKRTLHQDVTKSTTDDGMDAAICLIKPKEGKLIFAGAKSQIFYCDGEQTNEIKGNLQSLGYKLSKYDYEYTNHEVPYNPDFNYYLTTDGFIEQMGGPKSYPFGKARLKKLLSRHYGKSFDVQKDLIRQEHKKYRSDFKQLDDITVIGFKL